MSVLGVSPITFTRTLPCAAAFDPTRTPSEKPKIVTSLSELLEESNSTAAFARLLVTLLQLSPRIPCVPPLPVKLIWAQTVDDPAIKLVPVLKLILVYGPELLAVPEISKPVPRIWYRLT